MNTAGRSIQQGHPYHANRSRGGEAGAPPSPRTPQDTAGPTVFGTGSAPGLRRDAGVVVIKS